MEAKEALTATDAFILVRAAVRQSVAGCRDRPFSVEQLYLQVTYYIQTPCFPNPRQSTESRQAEIIATMLALAAQKSCRRRPSSPAMSCAGRAVRHFQQGGRSSWRWPGVDQGLDGELGERGRRLPMRCRGWRRCSWPCAIHPGFRRPRFVFAELQQPGDSPVRQCVRRSCTAPPGRG